MVSKSSGPVISRYTPGPVHDHVRCRFLHGSSWSCVPQTIICAVAAVARWLAVLALMQNSAPVAPLELGRGMPSPDPWHNAMS